VPETRPSRNCIVAGFELSFLKLWFIDPGLEQRRRSIMQVPFRVFVEL
jgi:hypothetical protein